LLGARYTYSVVANTHHAAQDARASLATAVRERPALVNRFFRGSSLSPFRTRAIMLSSQLLAKAEASLRLGSLGKDAGDPTCCC
jgi:hypothetical protein